MMFAQPMASILLAVSQFTHARMRYCYWIHAHILEVTHALHFAADRRATEVDLTKVQHGYYGSLGPTGAALTTAR